MSGFNTALNYTELPLRLQILSPFHPPIYKSGCTGTLERVHQRCNSGLIAVVERTTSAAFKVHRHFREEVQLA